MRVSRYIRGSVLPTVIVVSVLILAGMLGLLALWEQQTLLAARNARLGQARADAESAFRLYRLHPEFAPLTDPAGFRLHDSLPGSEVRVVVRPWGLYEAVSVCTADSLARAVRLMGIVPESEHTLWYADGRTALTLAGRTELRGQLRLPQKGVMYGRVNADMYSGPQIPQNRIRRSEAALSAPVAGALIRVRNLLDGAAFPEASPSFNQEPSGSTGGSQPISGGPGSAFGGPPTPGGPNPGFPDSVRRSFADSTLVLRLGDAEIGDCDLRGRIALCAGELRIDASCRLEHLIVCARKITVGAGARITAQLFARDTVIVEADAALEYPSGIFAGVYAEVGDRVRVDGYVIVRDTVVRKKITANYRQSRTARVRGLLWVDGAAQVQGIVAGQAVLRQGVYFSPQGYYRDMLYDVTLLANPHTAQPLWQAGSKRRKEAACVH